MTHSVLFVAALEEELEAFTEPLPGVVYNKLITGPGKVSAAIELANWLAANERAHEYAPDWVINIGTCASPFDAFIGVVCDVSKIIEYDLDVRNLLYFIGENYNHPITISSNPEGVYLATGDRVVTDRKEGQRMADAMVQIVDMEAYALARVCEKWWTGDEHHFRSWKYVTDMIGAEQQDVDFRDAMDQASKTLWDWAKAADYANI